MRTFNGVMVGIITDNEAFQNVFIDLAFRWDDECKYEDINDYIAPIMEVLKSEFPCVDFSGIRMLHAPFGIYWLRDYQYKDDSIRLSDIKITFETASGILSWSVKPHKS